MHQKPTEEPKEKKKTSKDMKSQPICKPMTGNLGVG